MGVATRKFNRHIKSLMHFDYPYYDEPGDGMRDEIGVLNWTNEGNAIFVGAEVPAAQIVAGTPKFGYRCLQTSAASDYLEAPVTGNYLDIKSAKSYEIEFFIRKTNASAGNIVNLLDSNDTSLFTVSTDASNNILVTSSAMSIAGTSSTALTLSTWTHVRVRINQGAAYIFINGVSAYSGTCSLSVSDVAKIRLGGFIGQLDEFMIRNAVSNDNVPEVPYKGHIDLYGMGGNGRQGRLILNINGTNKLNSVYNVASVISSSKFTITGFNVSDGIHGSIEVGDELMLLKRQANREAITGTDTGLYAFRKIIDITGTTITLNSPITEFTFEQNDTYNLYACLVPNYTSVNIASGVTVIPSGTVFPIVFRSQGDVTINGNLLSSGYSDVRNDIFQMTHNHLPERFIMGSGGGVIILSEGTVTISDSARLGASWSGSGTYGTGGPSTSPYVGGNAGSGYGGGGSSYPYGSSQRGSGGAGGVGYGGECYHYGNNSGRNGGRPGSYVRPDISWFPQGSNPAKRGNSAPLCIDWCVPLANSGANVMIICRQLSASMDAISTGGSGGKYTTSGGGAISTGAGTGMCYLAYEEAI